MIPAFPEFASLSLDQKPDFDAFMKPFPPYSDFHFSGMWFWDTDSTTLVSELHGNLVLVGPDYLTSAPTVSFMGTEAIPDTIGRLFAYSDSLGIGPVIRRVPEIVVDNLSTTSGVCVEADPDNHDYVYSVEDQVALVGGPHTSTRHGVNRFRRHHGDETITGQLDLSDPQIISEMMGLFDLWASRSEDRLEQSFSERQALRRLLDDAEHFDLVAHGIRADGRLVAMAIDEILPDGWDVGHFAKADTSFRGIYDHLWLTQMRAVADRGCIFVNLEQDLGLPHLREAKRRKAPVRMLRKYTLRSG